MRTTHVQSGAKNSLASMSGSLHQSKLLNQEGDDVGIRSRGIGRRS